MKQKPSPPRPAGPKSGALSRKPARLEREAQALRANLLKRKAQDRARKPSPDR